MKDKFITLLGLTEKKNIDLIIGNLEKLGFFEAPASTRFHLDRQGGLLEHSVNVCNEAMALRESLLERHPELSDKLPLQSTIFCALMHDICKAEIYKEVKKWRKDQNNQWETYTAYEPDYSHLPLGHGEKSVIRLLTWGVEMTQDEMLAIRWHMSAWDLPFQSNEEISNLNAARAKCPLLTVLQTADMIASGIIETEQ